MSGGVWRVGTAVKEGMYVTPKECEHMVRLLRHHLAIQRRAMYVERAAKQQKELKNGK
jgi:hypothetical protein